MKKISVILLSLISVLYVSASKAVDTTYSKYEKKIHSTTSIITVEASKAVCMSMVDDLVSQFRGDPSELFEWALAGLGKQEGEDNEKNEVLLILKQAIYDKTTGVGTLILDIDIQGLKTYKNVSVDSKVVYNKVDEREDAVSVDIFYSNSLLKKAYGTLFVKELSESKCLLTMNISVRFGWFFNIFISQRRYKNLVEWRSEGFMRNMKQQAAVIAAKQKKIIENKYECKQ